MKYRSDFVTNSSSSSFLIGFQSKDDGIKTITEMSTRYGSMFVDQLLADFMLAQPLSLDALAKHYYEEFEGDAEWDLDVDSGRWDRKPSFKEQWMLDHPNATKSDYYNSEERKTKIHELVQKWTESLIEAAKSKSYLVELEYEDHGVVGSELEHVILPNQDFTIRQFSHH